MNKTQQLLSVTQFTLDTNHEVLDDDCLIVDTIGVPQLQEMIGQLSTTPEVYNTSQYQEESNRLLNDHCHKVLDVLDTQELGPEYDLTVMFGDQVRHIRFTADVYEQLGQMFSDESNHLKELE